LEEDGKNAKIIIFILTDSVRTKNLNCYGYSKPTSPNISDLAKEGVLFENAYACSNGTDSSLMTISSGKYPRSHGVISHGSRTYKQDLRGLEKSPKMLLLPEILQAHGYVTVAISPMGWGIRATSKWHRRGYGLYYDRSFKLSRPWIFIPKIFRWGIESLLELSRLDQKLGIGQFDAKTSTDAAIETIRKYGGGKLFLFIDYLDAHPSYSSPLPYLQRFYDEKGSLGDRHIVEEAINRVDDKSWISFLKSWLMKAPNTDYVIAQYNGAIAFIDHEIGRLLNVLDKYGLSDKTLIVLTSDHGQSLTEHGIYFDSHGLYDESIHVPLIFKFPKCPKNKRVKEFVQHIDIAPTILDILGTEKPKFDGESLIPLMQGKTERSRSAVYAEEGCTEWKIAIRTEKYKYIHAPSKQGAICRYCDCVHGGMKELYDLTIDPEETRNLIEEKPEVAEKLRKDLFAWVRSFKKARLPIRLYDIKTHKV